MEKDNVIFLHSFRERRTNPDLKEAIEGVRQKLRDVSEKIALSIGKEGNEATERERLDRFLEMYLEVQELMMEVPENIQSPKEVGAVIQLLNDVAQSLFHISEELKKEGESFLGKNKGG